ncbi:efflux transporter outer membrane subunit [Candidatus Berkiella cookevillensis]|uniref:Efflux transporter outer membrane subunit n=1 Tax=Candidatus Berkiella cookevillensis TaxID=437022 RepID=A0A0Q9YN09_9GAMM|nr:efflux transporter outer membrane subunit [Candidatus Berkiella cookevillensis]MCS5707371.1 efflux transporter outer membrane subunit [Candidatus Berkiella cookevillensis]
MKYRVALAALTTLCVSACSAPHIPYSSCSQKNTAINLSLTEAMTQEQRWWYAFNDPLLNQLVDQLLLENINLQIAYARLQEARALTKVARSDFFPHIAGVASATRANVSSLKPETLSQIGFDAQWELDLFGKTRASVQAAKARTQAHEAAIDDVKNIIIADLARAVIEWRQAQQSIQEVNHLLHGQDQQVSILNIRANAGLIDASFAKRAQAQREQTATQLPLAYATAEKAQYQIETLVNSKNNAIAFSLDHAKEHSVIVPTPQQITILPLEIIKQRPDLRASYNNLLAARADLAQAEASLWPQINVSGFFGVQEGTHGLVLAENPIWSIANTLSIPILNFGRLRGLVKSADARAQQALLEYENNINLALQECRTALSDYLHGINAMNRQAQTLRHRQETVEIARERFERGLTDMTDLTTAQTELDQASLSFISSKTSAAIAYIKLQKALGTATFSAAG